MSRSRTSSLPVRPHSSSGPPTSMARQKIGQKIYSLKTKARDRGEAEEATSTKAASSSISVVDPFAANPNASSSFVTFTPTTPTTRKLPAPLTIRPPVAESDENESVMSQPVSPTSPTPAAQSFSPPARRRGSILVAASDALSSFARKTPMRSLHLNMGGIGRTNSTKSFVNGAQPIVLTEVIEISESAIRASKRREEEEAERERLRDAAARALGINDKEGETSSMNSRQRSGGLLDLDKGDEEGNPGNGDYHGWGDDAITPTATSLPSLPPASTHSRTRSGSYIPPHTLASLPARSPTPLSSLSSQHTSSHPLGSAHPQVPKSFSTPPASIAIAPTLRINTFNSTKTVDDTLSCPIPEIPAFPSTPAALSPFTQLSGTMPRYYPAPSLLMFTLTKQWKNRYLVFTTPMPSPASQRSVFRSPWSSGSDSSSTTPVPSYLHLFKTSGSDEKEVERLEINEESVVYVAEGEVGGRKGVIKVGGSLRKKASLTGSARRPSTSSPAGTAANMASASSRTSSSSMGSVEEPMDVGMAMSVDHASGSTSSLSAEGRTMWIVQIPDPEEAQEWIGVIKGAVLNQRSIRAGLGTPSAVNGMEPRGDLDVVLSMRAQGLFPSPTVPHADYNSMNGNATIRSQGAISPTNSTFASDSRYASSITQLPRSQSTTASNVLSSTTASINSGETGSTVATSYASGSSSPIPRATTALKSLFTIGGGRPRSPSTSSLTPPSSALEEDDRPEDSFGHAGASLMGMIRSNTHVNDITGSPSTPTVPSTPRACTPIVPPEAFLERKILPDPDRRLLESSDTSEPPPVKKPLTTNSLGFGRPKEIEDRHIVPTRVSSEGITSVALQPPPPRKRAGTVNSTTVSVSVSSPTDSSPSTASYAYSHTNTSTAESLGVSMGVKSSNLLTPPLPPTPTSAAVAKLKDRRVTRASWSSVSTHGSGDQTPSSPDEARSRRWSRRSSVPHRMSPPYPSMSSPPSSPLMQDTLAPSMRHPYASEDVSLSRSSSVGSGHGRVSELHARPFSARRASAISVQTSSTSSTQHSYPAMANSKPVFATGRPKASHRTSLPPPQRPAPISALPPTPSENGHTILTMSATQSLPAPKGLRESLILRGNKRLSTIPPTQPPASALPPRPDEPGYRPPTYGHRRSSSSGNPSSPLVPSESMPTSAVRSHAPTLPPISPLPLPPRPHTATSSSPPRSTSLIKRRLRILSSPPTAPPSTAPPQPSLDGFAEHFGGANPVSIPESPIIPGPIMTFHNDPSFLRISPQTPDDDSLLDAAPQGLSPPPRRGSRQITAADKETLQDEIGTSRSTESGDGELSHDVKDSDIPALAPPPELDAFAPLPALAVRSSEHSAVSLVDVRI
ncbi:hypothetical protein BDY19DRAFT_969236 [Irpex rosettiformis]|uniref:Uncharacterized protein n=1 Tax=Irpex rosettiformis TaxID=378272 RepID=A0ACB8TRY1_9APHY|nr:hypothetical protein BDY19DRAFT_969236 [Irpex rosettiformis]